MYDSQVNNRRIARNSIFLSIRMVIVLCITLYTTRVTLRILGVEDYGVYNVVCGFVSMFAFLNTSMSNGIQRFFNYELGRNGIDGANRVYCTSVLIQLFLGLFIVVFAESFGMWYLHNKMIIPDNRLIAAKWVFQFSVVSFIFIIMQAPFSAAIMAHERMDYYAFVSVLDAVLKLGIVLVLPRLSYDKLIVYGILLSLISILNFSLYFAYSKKNFIEIKFKKGFDKALFRSMLGFSGWNLFGSFSGIMKEQGINLILNFFFGPVVNAARGVAAQVQGGLESFVQNITTPVRPQVMQSYATGNIERTMKLTYSISKLSCCFYYLIALPIVIELDYILHLWLGENVPSHTSSFIVIIMLTAMIAYLNSAVSGVVHASGQMKAYQLTTGIIGLASVPIAFIVLKFGSSPEWALIVTLVSKAIAQVFSLFILKRIVTFSIRDYCLKVLFPILLVIGVSFMFPIIVHCLLPDGFLRLITVCIVSLGTVGVSVFYLGLNQGERQLITQLALGYYRKLFELKKGGKGHK